jgi:transcriptional regulator with XRE-family HTH domain
MHLGTTINKIREQKQVVTQLGIGQTNYNKLQNGGRKPCVKEFQQLAALFSMIMNQILNYEGDLPK